MTKYELSLKNIKKGLSNPMRAVDEVAVEYAYRLPSTILNGYRLIGTNVFDKDWDVLIILDTCRIDALETVGDKYDFLSDIGSLKSVGGSSAEWIARTFDTDHRDEISNTAYLSANTHTEGVLDIQWQNTNEKHASYRALRHMPTVDIGDLGKAEYLFKYEPWGQKGP